MNVYWMNQLGKCQKLNFFLLDVKYLIFRGATSAETDVHWAMKLLPADWLAKAGRPFASTDDVGKMQWARNLQFSVAHHRHYVNSSQTGVRAGPANPQRHTSPGENSVGTHSSTSAWHSKKVKRKRLKTKLWRSNLWICCCCCKVASVVSDSVWPHRRQPTRLPRPWHSPGKNTGVGCHFLLQCINLKSESELTQSCQTLRKPRDCSPPGSSVHGILEWGAIAFSRLWIWDLCLF